MSVLRALWEALYTGAGLFWRAAWALALGYAISALIQVFVSRRQAARHLGAGGPRQLALAGLLGFAASSCSFAALSATRSLWVKGAALPTALAFMFASTNLAVEVAALAFIFLGWQYALALFLGAPVLITVMAVLVRLTARDRFVAAAHEHAEHAEGHDMDPAEELPAGVRAKLRTRQAWRQAGQSYVAEWRMVYKELVVGFLVAGAVATLVPAAFWKALFPSDGPAWLIVPLQALLAPVLAIGTFIGSMGNGPLAAILASNGVLFGAIMAFLYSDFVVPPALRINARYYGWRFAVYLGVVFAVAAVVTGVVVHAGFALVGLLPRGAKDLTELATFAIDYTFWLNLLALAVAAALVYAARRPPSDEQRSAEPDSAASTEAPA